MKLEIYLIRHAESEINLAPDLIQGRQNNSKLTERGLIQAEKLAERLALEKIRFDRVYSSPAVRAYDTARIACRKIGFSEFGITRLEDLLEMSLGEWEGKERSLVYTPEVLKEIKKDCHNFNAHGGESMKMAEQRMYNFITNYVLPVQAMIFESSIAKKAEGVLEHRLIRDTRIAGLLSGIIDLTKSTVLGTQKESSKIAVFSHAMAIKCLLRNIMQADPQMMQRMRMFNTCISRLEYTEKGWYPVCINDAGHLAGLEHAPFTLV